MGLKALNLPISITTGYQSPVEEYFTPVLKNSITYDVAVGYFTSGWLRDTAEGMAEFALAGGISRWIISPQLAKTDAQSIINSTDNLALKDDSYYERELIEVIDSLQSNAQSELCSLISAGILQFRIAVPLNKTSGMFHAKLGVSCDSDGDKVAFSGSYNLTAAAKSNWEHLDIFKSWQKGDEERIVRLEQRFDALWNNNDPSYKVFIPSHSLTKLIKKKANKQTVSYFLAQRKDEKTDEFTLREYQKKAIESWGKNSGRGTYDMATGSGKTVTALATIKRLISNIVEDKKKPLFIVIVLPLKHLLEQWADEAEKFGFHPVKCYETSSIWRESLATRIGTLNVTGSGYVVALVTNATFSSNAFQAVINQIKVPFLLVADEAHNLGTPATLDLLPENANFRLALSATPERHNDAKGTQALYDYFGEPVIQFTLEDAINSGFLCPYEYHPHLCLMSESEYEEYIEISDEIAIEAEKSKVKGDRTKRHSQLLGKRTDLISGVDSKLDVLEELLIKQKEKSNLAYTLVYCGSRRGENNERYIERTVKLIGKLGIKTRKFTADESMEDRREILDLFAKGELESIAAIKCLDEGVDVPVTRIAYILASTSNPREYIQRRGRVLRKADGKDMAVIHDFIVAPPSSKNRENDIVLRELDRAHEFASLALNIDECGSILQGLEEEYGVEE